MQWIIDLISLIDKFKNDNDKQTEWEPEPLYKEIDYDDLCDKCKQESDNTKEETVIIIDL